RRWRPPRSTLLRSTTLFRSNSPSPPNSRPMPGRADLPAAYSAWGRGLRQSVKPDVLMEGGRQIYHQRLPTSDAPWTVLKRHVARSEEHTSALQSRENLVCRL